MAQNESVSVQGVPGNVASALCYFPLLAIVFLLIAPYNHNKTVRFHAWQSIGLAVCLFVVQFALAILTAMVTAVGFLSTAVGLAGLVVFIIAMVKAYRGEKLWIPALSPFAEKHA